MGKKDAKNRSQPWFFGVCEVEEKNDNRNILVTLSPCHYD